MADSKKLMMRIKNKVDADKLTINSQMYFIVDTAVYSTVNMTTQKSSLQMAWLDGEMLKIKTIYEPAVVAGITKIIAKSEKQANLVMMSDGAIVVISSKDPKSVPAQVIRQQGKP
jgi:hypothetical protein